MKKDISVCYYLLYFGKMWKQFYLFSSLCLLLSSLSFLAFFKFLRLKIWIQSLCFIRLHSHLITRITRAAMRMMPAMTPTTIPAISPPLSPPSVIEYFWHWKLTKYYNLTLDVLYSDGVVGVAHFIPHVHQVLHSSIRHLQILNHQPGHKLSTSWHGSAVTIVSAILHSSSLIIK